MGFFQKRKATQTLMVAVSHPLYAPRLTAAETEQIIAQGADVNASMPESKSPLSHVSVWGNVGAATVLLAHGADPNGNHSRRSIPLHIAAKNGHTDLVRLLVERGAEVNARDTSGRTALHHAVIPDAGRRSQVLETLVSFGADATLVDSDGQTPLAKFRDTVQALVGRQPVGNETRADLDRRDRELTDDLRRLTALLSSR